MSFMYTLRGKWSDSYSLCLKFIAQNKELAKVIKGEKAEFCSGLLIILGF